MIGKVVAIKGLGKRITDTKVSDIKTDLVFTPYGISLAFVLIIE